MSIADFGVVFGIIAACIAGAWGLLIFFDAFGQKPGKLRDPTPYIVERPVRPPVDVPIEPEPFIPSAPDSATVISTPNEGGSEVLVKQVILHDYSWKKTPHRERLMGQANPVRAIFHGSRFKAQKKIVLTLPTPIGVKPGEWVAVQLAIVEKKWHGWTYVGSVSLVYDDNNIKTIKNVQLDVLQREPPQLSMP